MRKNKRCTDAECPLWASEKEVPYAGNKEARIIYCGESPGKQEKKDGKPFVGAAGDLSKEGFRRGGLRWEAVLKINASRCMINKKKLAGKAITSILSHCRVNVEGIIKAIEPKIIILAGDFAMKQILKRSGITKARGTWVWSKEFDCWCLPVFHPAYILRNMALKSIFIKDLKSVADCVRNAYEPPTDMGDTTYKEVDTIRQFIDAGKPCAMDTETQGLDKFGPNFVGIGVSLSNKEGTGSWLRLYEETDVNGADFTLMWPRALPGKKKKEPTEIYVRRVADLDNRLDELQEFCEDAKIKKYMMNGNYDIHVLRRVFKKERKYDLRIAGYALDVQAGAHLLDENLFKYASLEILQQMFTDLKVNYNTEFALAWGKDDMLAVPEESIREYASADADVTLRVARGVRGHLLRKENRKLANYYVKMVHPTLDSLRAMEENGAYIDREKLDETTIEVNEMVAEAQRNALKQVKRSILNYHKDLGLKLTRKDLTRDALFSKNGFNLIPVKRTKTGPSVDKEARIRMKDGRLSKKARAFLDYYDEWSELHTLSTRYLKGFNTHIKPDGRIHTSLSLAITVSGRVSSSNPNMMNNPKRSKSAKKIRKLIAAPKGTRLLAVDESQSELRWMADVANDPTMIKIFRNESLDIHTETAKSLYAGDWSKLTADDIDKQRRNAKTVNFGLIYGMMTNGFIKYAKVEYGVDLSWDQAEAWIEIFFGKYDGLPVYHKDIVDFCVEHGYVESPFGRRRRLPEIYSNENFIRSEAERQAINTPIQGPSSDTVLIALNELRRKKRLNPKECKPILFVHDELVFEVKDKDSIAEKYAKAIKEEMEHPPIKKLFNYTMKVPLLAEIKQGYNYGELSDLHV